MPLKKLRGTTWKYYDVAPSAGFSDTMIILHGGGIRPEAMYEHIIGLAQAFRVVCPWFPEYFTEIDDYVAGLFLIMRNENIKKSHFFGIGFGAVVALHFVYRHPGRVLSCTLTYGMLPSENKVRLCEKAIKKMDFSVGPLKRLLTGVWVKNKDIEEHVLELKPGERDFWIRNLKNFAATKAAIQVRLEALLDYHLNFNYKPEDFSRWQGKLLLIDSRQDFCGFDSPIYFG
jgi:pimeloyl-ACP methyl ester carboxylesterase